MCATGPGCARWRADGRGAAILESQREHAHLPDGELTKVELFDLRRDGALHDRVSAGTQCGLDEAHPAQWR